MQLSVSLPSFTGYNDDTEWRVPTERYKHYARRAEQLGFAGIWAYDHLTPPQYYGFGACLDPLIALAHVAEVTDTIPLGTDILILPLRNPVMVASRAATLQHLSNARLTLGLGAGYVESEFDAVNIPYEERFARFHEGIHLLARLLTERSVTHEGTYYPVTDLTIEPHLDRPPRILAGGTGVPDEDGSRTVAEKVMERIAGVDGWIAGPWSPEAAAADWADIDAYLNAKGETPAAYDRVIMTFTHLYPNLETSEARTRQRSLVDRFSHWGYAKDNYTLGSIEDIIARLREYEAIGFDEVILSPITSDLHALDQQLEHWADHLLPAFA